MAGRLHTGSNFFAVDVIAQTDVRDGGGRMPDHPLYNSGRSTRCARVNLIDLAHCDVRLARSSYSKDGC